MSEKINIEGAQGRIVWDLPDRLSKYLNTIPIKDKQEILNELYGYVNSFTHLLWGSMLLPPEQGLRNFIAISLFIKELAQQNLSELKRRGFYEG